MKGMYIPPVGWLETLLHGPVDDFTDMMMPRATGDDEYQYGSSWTDRSRERVEEMIERDGSPQAVLDRINQGTIGLSSDWKGDVIHYLQNQGSGASSSSGQGADDAGGSTSGPPPGNTQGQADSTPNVQGSSRDDDDDDRGGSPPEDDGYRRRRRDRDDYSYRSRRTVAEPLPLTSGFATGEWESAGEDAGALDPQTWDDPFREDEQRMLIEGLEDERRAFLEEERGAERQRVSKGQEEGASQRDYLYDALWYSESTQELTEEQLELLYAQMAGLRETGVTGADLYQAIGQSEVVAGMNEEQRDTLVRDVGVAEASSAAAQGMYVDAFGAGSDIGPNVPDPARLLDLGREREIDRQEQGSDLLGGYDKGDWVDGGLDPSDIGPRVPDPARLLDLDREREIDRQEQGSDLLGGYEKPAWVDGGLDPSDIGPRVPDPARLLDLGREREIDRQEQGSDLLGGYDKGDWVDGGLDPSDIGPRVPDPARLLDLDREREIDRQEQGSDLLGGYEKPAWVDGGLDPSDIGPRVPDPARLLDRGSAPDIDEQPENLLDKYAEAAGSGIEPYVPDPTRLLDRGSRLDFDERASDLGGSQLAAQLAELKAQGGGVWRRDPDTGDLARVPDDEVDRWLERPHVPDPTRLLDGGSRPDFEEDGEIRGSQLAAQLAELKAQGGGVWRRDPATGDLARVPDDEVDRWLERPHVPDPTRLLDGGSRPDFEEDGEIRGSQLAAQLAELKAQGGGVWRRDPDTGDLARVPDDEVDRWLERPHVSDPASLIGRGGGAAPDGVEQGVDLLGRYEKAAAEAGDPDPFDAGPYSGGFDGQMMSTAFGADAPGADSGGSGLPSLQSADISGRLPDDYGDLPANEQLERLNSVMSDLGSDVDPATMAGMSAAFKALASRVRADRPDAKATDGTALSDSLQSYADSLQANAQTMHRSNQVNSELGELNRLLRNEEPMPTEAPPPGQEWVRGSNDEHGQYWYSKRIEGTAVDASLGNPDAPPREAPQGFEWRWTRSNKSWMLWNPEQADPEPLSAEELASISARYQRLAGVAGDLKAQSGGSLAEVLQAQAESLAGQATVRDLGADLNAINQDWNAAAGGAQRLNSEQMAGYAERYRQLAERYEGTDVTAADGRPMSEVLQARAQQLDQNAADAPPPPDPQFAGTSDQELSEIIRTEPAKTSGVYDQAKAEYDRLNDAWLTGKGWTGYAASRRMQELAEVMNREKEKSQTPEERAAREAAEAELQRRNEEQRANTAQLAARIDPLYTRNEHSEASRFASNAIRDGALSDDAAAIREQIAELTETRTNWYDNRQPSGYDDENEPFYLQRDDYSPRIWILRARLRDLASGTGDEQVMAALKKYSDAVTRGNEIDNQGDEAGSGEGGAAVERALQVSRERGASREELQAQQAVFEAAVGDGSTAQQQANIAKIKEITRPTVFTDFGSGYEQRGPGAVIEIGVDESGNVVGGYTGVDPDQVDRPNANEVAIQEQHAAILAEIEAMRGPVTASDQRIAAEVQAFNELKELTGPEGFSGQEFRDYVASGQLPDRLSRDGQNQQPAAGATAGAPDPRVGDAAALSATGGLNPAAMAAIGVQETDTGLHDVTTIGEQREQEAAAEAWAAEASAYLEAQGIDTSEMTDAEMEALVDPAAASAERQHEREVAQAQSDQMGYLEAKGYDPETIEGMSQSEIDNLVDVNVASDQQAVAQAQSDRMGYLEAKGYDPETIEGMSQSEIDNLVDVNVASDQQAAADAVSNQRDAVALAQSDIMGYLEAKGYDPETIEGMSQDEMVQLAQVNVASDQQALARAEQLASLGEFDGSDLGGMGEFGYSLENPEVREAIAEGMLDTIAEQMSPKDIAALGTPYVLDGVKDYVATQVFEFDREPGLTDEEYAEQYEAAYKEALDYHRKIHNAFGSSVAPALIRDHGLTKAQGEVVTAQEWFRPWEKPDGTQETAQEWANRVVNQGSLDAGAVAWLGSYLFPEGTDVRTVGDGRAAFYNPNQAPERAMTWPELARKETGERQLGKIAITGAELGTVVVGTAGAMRLPAIAKPVFRASNVLGRGSAATFRGLSRVPGLTKLSRPGAQNLAAKSADTVVQGSAEAAIDVLLSAAVPLEPIQALTPERMAQLTAFEIGAEAATNLARFTSAKTGATLLSDITKVGFEDVPLTGWGGRTGPQRRAYIQGAIDAHPSLADDFDILRATDGTPLAYNPKTEVGAGLLAEAQAFTRIRDGLTSGMTDAGLARIARSEGVVDPEAFVAKVKNTADTAVPGLFQVGGRPTFTFGDPPGPRPLVTPPAGIPTPTAATVPHSAAATYQPIPGQPGVPVAYTPPGRTVPAGVAGQHTPGLTPAEIAALIGGDETPTTHVTFAPTPAEGITNLAPTTHTSFVTPQMSPPVVPVITNPGTSTTPPAVTPIIIGTTPVTVPPTGVPPSVGVPPTGVPPSVGVPPTGVPPTIDVPPPGIEVPPTIDVPPPGIEVPPTIDVPPPGIDVPPTIDVPPPGIDVPPTIDVPPPGEVPPPGIEVPPSGGEVPPEEVPPGDPEREPEQGDPEKDPEDDAETEPEDGETEPEPEDGRSNTGPATTTPIERSAMSAATPTLTGRAAGLMPFPFPPGAGVPVLPFGGFRRGAGGAMIREGNPRVVQWRQRTQLVADLDTGQFTERAISPPTGVIITMKDQTAPAPHVRIADTMEVTPGETWVEVFPRAAGKTSRATDSDNTGAWEGGRSAKGENPRVVSWIQNSLITHDLDEGMVTERALSDPMSLQVVSSGSAAPRTNRRLIDVMEVRPTAGGVAVRPRSMPKVSRETRAGRGNGKPAGTAKAKGKAPKRASAGRLADTQKAATGSRSRRR